jgi:hypothetical protein
MTELEQLAWDILSTPDNADFKKYRETHSTTWLTKDRKILLMRDMETAHIISCVNMLEAVGQIDTAAYKGLIDELRKRGQHDNKI